MAKEKKKKRFNFIDIIIILIVVGVIAAVFIRLKELKGEENSRAQ